MGYETICGVIVMSVFGLITGSFLNVCIYRIPRGISVATGNRGRSMCVRCGHDLQWFDMIPLLSYLFLRGKCRYCRKPVSLQYPIVEGSNGVLWALSALVYGISPQSLLYALFFSILIVVSGIDWMIQEIPYRLELAIGVVALASLLFPGFPGIGERVAGMLIIAVPMAVGAMFGAFGGGDVQLVFVSGFLLGWRGMLIAFFAAVMTGAVHAVWAVASHKADRKMPFGPYLAIGMITAALWGSGLWDWYWGMFI